MNEKIILAGIACVIAAVIGGGVNILGAEIPKIISIPRQILLAAVGVVIIIVGGAGWPPNKRSGSDGPFTANDESAPPADAPAEKSPVGNDLASAGAEPASAPKDDIEATNSTPDSTVQEPTLVKRLNDAVDGLRRNPPTDQYTQNQFAKGYLNLRQFDVAGIDIKVSGDFKYDRDDGTGWPPASPPVASVNDYFCVQNADTKKLLQEQTHVVVSITVLRGPNSNAFNFTVDCSPGASKVGPQVN